MIFTLITSQGTASCAVGMDLNLVIAYMLKDRILAYWAYTFSTLESIENLKNADDEQDFFKNGVGDL